MGPSARHHPVVTTHRREKYFISATSRKGCASSQHGVGYKTAITGVSLLVMALFSSRAKGSVFDTPHEDLEQDDFIEYGKEVGIATAGLGIGLSAVFGALTFISMLAMCCRCSRMHREDLAILEAERNTGDADKGLDDLYEVEDYEDKISAQRGMLRVLTLSLFLGYLFCAAYAYHGAKTADAAFNDIFDGTDALLTRTQNALCAENGAEDCAGQSVGEFLLHTVAALIDFFDNIVEFLTSLTAVVTPLYWVSANLTTAGSVLYSTEVAVVNINASIPIVNSILTGDGSVAELTDDTTLLPLDASILESIDDGKTALEAASNLTTDSITDVLDQLSGPSSSLARVQYQIDDINGNEMEEDEDARNSTTQGAYEALDSLRDTTRDIYAFQNKELADTREFLNNYVEIGVQVVAGIIFLPGVILFLTAICSGICQSSKPLYFNMCFVFLSQILFCLVAGVFLAVAKINGDLCDHHLDLLEANFKEMNITVQDTVIPLDYDKLYLVITCDGENGDIPTSTNNFIGILEAEQVFNMSKYLTSVSNMLMNNSDLLIAPKSTVKDAQDELTPLNDFVDMEVGEDVDIDAELDEINGLLKDVPSSPFDWDSRADQDAIDHFYLSDVTSFSWNNETTGDITYRSQLEAVNEIIGQMVPGIIGGRGFRDIKNPYNFTLARSLTSMTVCAETSNFYPDDQDPLKSSILQYTIYTYANQWVHLCEKVSEFAAITVEMEALIVKNDETRGELEDLRDSLEHMDENINKIHGLQAQMGLLRDDMNSSLIRILDSLDGFVDDIGDLAGGILGLNDHFMGASDYTMCGYIGTFYEDVYLDAMCTDLQGNIESVAGPTLCVVILMFVSFCVQGYYGPSMRERPRLNIDLEPSSAEELNAGTVRPNPPIPHSPTPLVGDPGF